MTVRRVFRSKAKPFRCSNRCQQSRFLAVGVRYNVKGKSERLCEACVAQGKIRVV